MDLISELKKNPFVLAPMAGITDVAFRSFMKSMGASIVVTELVSATGIKYASQKTLDLMKIKKDQHPVGVQIFGESLEDLKYATELINDSDADFVDLNFGCPVPKVVKKGAGSAILKDLDRVAKVFSTVKGATQKPLTVKIRTGWDETQLVADQICHLAYNEGLTWVAIHGRTRAQGYKGYSNWDYIKEIKNKSKVPVIGNGDICTAQQAITKLKESECDGVMIGRGCLKNPWIFLQAQQLYNKGSDYNLSEFNKEITKNFVGIFYQLQKAYAEDFTEKMQMLQLKKFAAWFSSGLNDSSRFRKEIFQADSLERVMECIHNYFVNINAGNIISENNEGFLMGGHG